MKFLERITTQFIRDRLKAKYPVEYGCIKKELESGKETGPDEYATLKQSFHGERFRQSRAEVEAKWPRMRPIGTAG